MTYIILFILLITVEWLIFLLVGQKENGKVYLCGANAPGKREKQKSLFCSLICLEFILFAGFRALNIGADTKTYLAALDYYKKMPRGEILTSARVYPYNYEWGYFLLTKLCAFLGLGSTAFLFVIAAIIYIPLFIFINRYSTDPFLSVLTYFASGLFAYSLGIFRQMIAISICLCGIRFVEKKKIVRYLIVCAVAAFFHKTALVMVLLYFVNLLKIKKRRWLFLAVVIAAELILFFFSRKVIELIIKIFPKYSGYIGSEYDLQGGSYLGLIYINVLLFFGLYFVVPRVGEKYLLSVKAIALAAILQSCAYSMAIFGRIVCYYSVFALVLLPLIAECFAKETFITKTILSIILMELAYITLSGATAISPYSFIWSR